ncbi:Chitinase [Acidisarcina polymorpha]|uniref:Chitinase n=1 Tax=Acidisarcina polymorpha TaxID=2211140 RepID=A0A2Z5G872_9BACT|nr:glycoside hydrolase family 18 protein [Acidisarcina polymorpha]AXC15261.1 Chitinase [Acidisarcina polymorpha]
MDHFPSRHSALAGVLVSFAAVLLPACSVAQDTKTVHPQKRIVGDYTYYSKFNNPPYGADQIPYHKLTHIIHAGVPFDAEGNLQVPDGFIEPEMITKAHDAGTKVVLLIGGDVPALETNPGMLKPLLKNLKTFVTEHDYDGLDLDWEYPLSAEDTAVLLKLMTALRATFPSPRYTLSIDAAPWNEPAYDVPHLRKVIDWFNIMTYDCAGPWTAHAQLNSPIFWDPKNPHPEECEPGASDQESADIFLADAPASQLNQGTPFYGYEYTNVKKLFGTCPNASTTEDGDCDDTVLTLGYGSDIKKLINKKGWVEHRDPVALVPYLLKKDGSPGFITYDDAESTYIRVWYSDWERGLGGTFLWALDEDYDGHSQDLLDAMYKASKRIPPCDDKPSK